ncbi:hypothetical protein A2110_00850 [Candidatus Jorgensenbacteria bacterium GWA1_54_12]|uniref:Uncharacterized protein n=1 Tax=Candidatus Jorgensenbacteria bacterium GWA1_54_12 TaxID=1798468 RepID=A0A1F6BL69_9BACT|nr:MAG: hypothetical protein A2110_00850 [Candidatus Jorgensenbacteria bacterium GWA1_54_12]
MREVSDGYIFTTFRDGDVIFYRDNYEKHCQRHGVIRGEDGREAIQRALIYPYYITSYTENSGKWNVGYIKKYRTILREIKTSRGKGVEYWEIILRRRPQTRRFKIATAYIAESLWGAIINMRVEKLEYKRR